MSLLQIITQWFLQSFGLKTSVQRMLTVVGLGLEMTQIYYYLIKLEILGNYHLVDFQGVDFFNEKRNRKYMQRRVA